METRETRPTIHGTATTTPIPTPTRTRSGIRIFQVMFGLFWIAAGISGLLGLVPPPSTSEAGRFLSALAATGYLLPLVSLVQVIAGALILTRRLAPLGLVVLAPVMVN